MSPSRPALLWLTLAAATPAAAQVDGTLDMGAGTYRPDRAIPGGIASIVPELRYHLGALELGAIGAYSDAPAGRWNFEGGTSAALRTPAARLLQLEATGQVGWTSHYRARGTTRVTGGVRAYLTPGAGTRAWVGRWYGRASALGTKRPLQRSEIGGSTRLGAVHLEFSVANTTVDRSLLFGAVVPSRGDSLDSDPVAGGQRRVERVGLTDAVVSGRWRIRSLDFDASVGRRFSRVARETLIWGVSASRSVSPSLALVAAAGRSGSDPVTSVPGARYFALGLRLKVGTQPVAPLPPAPKLDAAPFRIGPAIAAGREVVIRAVADTSVELAGDFTDWQPIALQRWGEDGWRAYVPIASGIHRLAVRIDGGQWQAPPGTRAIVSEFGGQVAEVVVE